MTARQQACRRRLIAYVGTYGADPGTRGGGIVVLSVSADGRELAAIGHSAEPKEAGYLVYASETRTLYSVDERKTDGRGPVKPAAAVHALSVDPRTGALTWLNSRVSPGPRPTFLTFSPRHRCVLSANHGDFQHVEKVRRAPDGTWHVEYVYDDSTLVAYAVEADGCLGRVTDVHIFAGSGTDPNASPQNGGHAQASPHAHCATLDPTEQYVLVCDKGTDQIYVFRLAPGLPIMSALPFAKETGPRHLAFDPKTGLAFATLEFSSELVCLHFDVTTGTLRVLDTISTIDERYSGVNEPAEVRVHPARNHVYVNNRGEDTLVWFGFSDAGRLTRLGSVSLATSQHPGLAARSFAFDETGYLLLLADRPAHLVRSFHVDADTGALTPSGQTSVFDPAFIALVALDSAIPEGPADA